MTAADAATPGYIPEPYNLQISSLIVLYRALYLQLDDEILADLQHISANFLREANSLIQESRQPSPFSPAPEEEYMPPEVFLETTEFAGHTQRLLRPKIGMELRHFRLVPREDAERSLMAQDPKISGMIAFVDLIQHPNTWWQVAHAQVSPPLRRQGMATMLYDRIAEVLNCEMRPSGWLSEDGYRFWRKRAPVSMEWYQQVGRLGSLWLNPKAVLNLHWAGRRELHRLMLAMDTGVPN